MEVFWLAPEEWSKTCAEEAHWICFDEKRPKELNRIDFALLVTDGMEPLSYMTCMELDSKSVYMQHGGALPPAKDTIKAYRAYEKMLSFLRDNYDRASTFIENENLVMMKAAMKQGLRITGLKYFDGKILLEHSVEWKG